MSETASDNPTTLPALLDLQPHGPDTWIGLSAPYFWGRVYGGQVVAQSLWAAFKTVEPEFFVHSLHSYFIRPGAIDEPIRFEVNRLRDGRSFCTRSVAAIQSSGTIFNMACSFQKFEEAAEIQRERMPIAPDPDELHPTDGRGWGWIMETRQMRSYPGAGQSMGWVRITDELDDDPRLHACGLAFTSDTFQFTAARSLHPLHVPQVDHHQTFVGASLDHALWFHRPTRADEWHLYDWDCRSLIGARGMTVGNAFAPDGTHLASIAQEVLLRVRRDR